MQSTQINSSRPKACQKLAGGKVPQSRNRRLRSASHSVTTLKGWQPLNPNGVPSLSPGLASLRAYPGSAPFSHLNPEGVASFSQLHCRATSKMAPKNQPNPGKSNLIQPISGKLASPQLRRSEIFVETQPSQNSKLRRSGISHCSEYVAPTELNNNWGTSATNMSLLRSYPMPQGPTAVAPVCAGARALARFNFQFRETHVLELNRGHKDFQSFALPTAEMLATSNLRALKRHEHRAPASWSAPSPLALLIAVTATKNIQHSIFNTQNSKGAPSTLNVECSMLNVFRLNTFPAASADREIIRYQQT